MRPCAFAVKWIAKLFDRFSLESEFSLTTSQINLGALTFSFATAAGSKECGRSPCILENLPGAREKAGRERETPRFCNLGAGLKAGLDPNAWGQIRVLMKSNNLKGNTHTNELYAVANRLTFEPHRIWLDPTGRYDEPLDREFPFIIKLFRYRHHDFTPGLTWHERLELFMPLDGPACMQMGKRKIELAPGELLIVDNLKLHMTVDTPELNTRVVVISFLPEFVYGPGSPSLDHVFLLPFYTQPTDEARVVRHAAPLLPQMHCVIAHLLQRYADRTSYFQAGCKVYLLELLYHLAQHCHVADFPRSELIRQQERAAKLKPLFEFVAHHYAEPMTLKQGASLTKMSLPQFMKLFKKIAGMTFVSYLTLVRLANAIPLLIESSLGIGEVAKQVGFSDQSYFDRRFKAVFYQTPRAFRIKTTM